MKNVWVKAWAIGKQAVSHFISDDAMSLGGALAFYTALSLAPLLVIVVAVAGFLWQAGDVRQEILRQVQNLIGPDGADAVKTILDSVGHEQAHGVAAGVGIGTLIFGATSVFAQLQYSLNRVWNVEAKPGEDVVDFLRKRLLSLGMILAVAFLLIVSLGMSTALSFLSGPALAPVPGCDGKWRVLNFFRSLV